MNPRKIHYTLTGYRALKVAILIFVVAYGAVAHWGGVSSPRGEYFPVFNWSLFTDVHDRRTLIEVYVYQIGALKFSRPMNYYELGEYFPSARKRSTALTKTLDRWYAATHRGDAIEISRLREVLERKHMSGLGAVTYEIRLVDFSPTERWKTGQIVRQWVLERYVTESKP